MKTRLLLFALIALLVSCKNQMVASSDDAAKYYNKSFDVTAFDGIKASLPADIEFVQSDTYEVSVACSKPVLDDIKVRVDASTLKLEYRAKVRETRDLKIKIRVTAPLLSMVRCSGAADFHCEALKQQSDLSVKLSGASDFEIDKARCNNIVFAVSGASDVDGDYTATGSFSCNVSGASDFDATCKAKDIALSASGASDVKMKVDCDRLGISCSGCSDVRVTGEASDVRSSSSGRSDINLSGVKRR